MDVQLECSIIILSYHQLDYTKRCLESIRQYTADVSYEVIVIDNGSDAETVLSLRQMQGIKLILNETNQGFAGGCNQGIKQAQGSYIMLLNNDTVVTEQWLYHMVRLLEEHPEIAMTGPLTNATVGKQMIPVPYDKDDMDAMQRFAHQISQKDAAPWRTLRLVAFCLLARRGLFDEIGLLDTNFKVGNYEDDDFNLRALCVNQKAYICRNSFVHHFMNVSFQQRDIKREQIMLANKQYLENKWKQLDWNHHAVYNDFMLQTVLACPGSRILHIGCGLGALEIELRDAGRDWYLTGMEGHPVRQKIASQFMDAMYEYSMQGLAQIEEKFDVIIIECTLEKWGSKLLKEVRRLLAEDGRVLLRVFNARHISTVEKAVTGCVEGNLLCAAADGFQYFYDSTLERLLVEEAFRVLQTQEIRKSMSHLQKRLLQSIKEFLPDVDEPGVYNRIYLLKSAV